MIPAICLWALGAASAPATSAAVTSAVAHVKPRVAVICTGADAGAVGLVQAALDRELAAAPEIALSPAAESVRRFGGSEIERGRAARADTQKAIADLLASAKEAYYSDHLLEALDGFAAAAALQDKLGTLPVIERVSLRLWRVAVFLALNQTSRAEAEAREAWRLTPAVKVDLSVFRPSVARLVERVRPKSRDLHATAINVAAVDATLTLDGETANNPVTARTGEHRLTVSAPGYRTVEQKLVVPGVESATVELPIAPQSALDAAIAKLLGAEGAAVDLRVVSEATTTLELDALVAVQLVAAPASQLRAALVWRGTPSAPVRSPGFGVSEGGVAQLGRFVLEAVRRGPPPPRPTDVRGGEVGAASTAMADAAVDGERATAMAGTDGIGSAGRAPPQSSWTAALSVGFTGEQLQRQLEGEGGGIYDLRLYGVGADARLQVSHGLFCARLGAAWASYATNSIGLQFAGLAATEVGGGWRAGASLDVGLRLAFSDDADGSALLLLAGGRWDEVQTEDPRVDGVQLGLLPASRQLGAEAVLGGVYALTPVTLFGASPRLELFVRAVPWSRYAEAPGDSSGVSPRPLPVIGWGVELRVGAAWPVALRYGGTWREVRFGGVGKGAFQPALTDARARELMHSLTLAIGVTL